MIIGQENICNKIDNLSIDSFPRSLMLVGPQGSGKHLIVNYIVNKFNLLAFDITEEISFELIDDLYNRVEPRIYIININALSIKEQNMILKFLEEPLANALIILLATTTGDILDTIMNRCQRWHLQNYTKEYLQTFSDNEYILKICDTPGQIEELVDSDFAAMFDLANKVVNKISSANLPNIMTISSKFGFKNERGKLDPKIFLKVLVACFRDACIENQTNPKLIQAYKLTTKLYKNSFIRNIDLKYLIDKYLLDVRNIMKEG